MIEGSTKQPAGIIQPPKMELVRYIRAGNWPVAAGYLLFTGMMAVGYFYNITFVQLGLVDLGVRVLGLNRVAVAQQMAVLALVTLLVALAAGWIMQRSGWNIDLKRKLQLALAIVLMQTALTAVAPTISSAGGLLIWIMICSFTLGIGVPVTFSLTTDLIPVRDRGIIAGIITALAYFMAAVFSGAWQIEALSKLLLWVMLPGTLILGLIVFLYSTGRTFVAQWLGELAQNHQKERFAVGRFLRDTARPQRQFFAFVILMFAIYFIDSLGFLRIIDTPIFVSATWQAEALAPRLTIGIVHALTALAAGILYTHLGRRHLFFWIFGLFALTHLTYTFHVWLLPETTSLSLGAPILYATAVSLYTVVNFALWADFSTPDTISLNTAAGVAISGWAATFFSTALSITWQNSGLPLETHLRSVNALAQLFFLLMLAVVLLRRRRQGAEP